MKSNAGAGPTRDSTPEPLSHLAPSSRTPRSADDLLGPLRGVLAKLMRSAELGSGDVSHAIPHLTEVAVELLDVDRSSVWMFRNARAELGLVDLFERQSERHSGEMILRAEDFPRYFKALAEERSIAATDAGHDPRTAEFREAYLVPHGIGSMLDAPVLLRGELVGVVCLEHVGAPRRWKPWEELVAGTFADFVGMVLGAAEQNAQACELVRYKGELERRVEERTRRLRESEESVRLLFEASPVAMILTSRAQCEVIALNARASELLALPPAASHGRPLLESWRKPAEGRRLLDLVAQEGAVDRFETELLGRDGLTFWANVSVQAMPYRGEPAYLFGVHDVTEQKMVEDKLRILATTDALTGALNRRRFFEVAEEELLRAERYGRDVSLAMIDADHFKSINDRFGHVTGDAALRALAASAQGQIRRSDVLARYGGEELAVLLPETRLDAAVSTMERVRHAVETAHVEHEGAAVDLSVSIGVVQRARGESLESVLRRADDALYAAKEKGRNRVMRG